MTEADSAQLSGLTYYRGRVALFAMLEALGIGAGDVVALQAFTCTAVPEAIMATGALPLWIDVEPAGFNMDADDLQRKLGPEVRAVVVQHTYGVPARMAPIVGVCSERGLPLIEDCCHTLSSSIGGTRVGELGIGAFYSWEWGKPLVAGIGGTAVANDAVLAAALQDSYPRFGEPSLSRKLRVQLQYAIFAVLYRPSLYWPVRAAFRRLSALGAAEGNYNPVVPGQVAEDFSLRMAAPLARRLRRKLRRTLAQQERHARRVASEYRERIASPAVVHPEIDPTSDVVFARYPLLVDNKREVLEGARSANVELAEWYASPVHPVERADWHLVHYDHASCPNAEALCDRVVTLPTHPAVTARDVDRAIRFLNAL